MRKMRRLISIIAVLMAVLSGFIWGPSPSPLFASLSTSSSRQATNQTADQTADQTEGPHDAAPEGVNANIEAISTFHSIGLTWSPNGASSSREAKVRFRPVGSSNWRDGHPLWFAGDGEYRGSLVELNPATEYEIELNNGEQRDVTSHRTWSETFPIADTVYVNPSRDTIRVNRSGSASGYILYTPAPGTDGVFDVNGGESNNIRVDAHHVIIRGFTLKNARTNAIELEDSAHDVIIEQNDISGWGRIDDRDGWGVNQDSAIFSSNEESERIIIQRNRMHHPRSDSNNWAEESYSTYGGRKHHPEGAQALYLGNSRGNHVIRYNEIYSDEDHKFNDCIGGGANSGRGFPGDNSDIYGNMVQDCWDDALEIEGYNENVRVWGNYTNRTFMHIAARPTQRGPLYIWRNVADSSRHSKSPSNWDDDKRGHFFKSGNLNDRGGGRVYVYHNTMLQNDGPSELNLDRSVGSSKGLSGAMRNYVSRNNIFYVTRGGDSIHQEKSYDNNDFDYDLYNGDLERISGHQQNGFRGEPSFSAIASAANVSSAKQGDFSLVQGSLGFDAAKFIPNFNDGFNGSGPDVGAHEAGTAAMSFGVNAGFDPVVVSPQPQPEPTALPQPTAEPQPEPTAVPQPEPEPEPQPEPSDPGPVAQCAGLDQEAETGAMHGMFKVGRDDNASGGGYVGVADYQGNRGRGPDNYQRAEYCIRVEQAGYHRLRAWSYGESGYDNSFYIQIDGQPTQAYLWHSPIDMTYPVETVTNYDPATGGFLPVELYLAEGVHTVNFYLREDGTRLDRFIFEPVGEDVNREIDAVDYSDRLVDDLSFILERMTEGVFMPIIR